MGRMIVFTNPHEGRESQYDEWYQQVHIPEILALEPFTAAQRYRVSSSQMGGEAEHTFAAVYEFDGSVDAAIAALAAAAPTFDMTEGGTPGSKMIFVEEHGPRVEA